MGRDMGLDQHITAGSAAAACSATTLDPDLLAFTQAQMRNAGMAMIVGMGALRVLREKKRFAGLAAMLEAWRHGRKARWLAEQDWEALLEQPLETVRRMLHISPPQRYAGLMP